MEKEEQVVVEESGITYTVSFVLSQHPQQLKAHLNDVLRKEDVLKQNQEVASVECFVEGTYQGCTSITLAKFLKEKEFKLRITAAKTQETQKQSKRKTTFLQKPYNASSAFHVVPHSTLPEELVLFKKYYQECRCNTHKTEDFVTNFLNAMKVELPEGSPYFTKSILWTQREEKCARFFIKRIQLLEQNGQHISSVFVGTKGTGKTTLIQKICIIAGALSDTLFVTYWDITNAVENPVEILNEALRSEGETSDFDNTADLLTYIRETMKKKVLLVIDEAHKYYVDKEAPESSRSQARHTIRQVYELGVAPGSCCILCGSSAKLTDLALKRKSTELAKHLCIQYPDYQSLNDQKFTPVVLPLIALGDLAAYLKFLDKPCDEQSTATVWLSSGGSLRYVINGSPEIVQVPLLGVSSIILLWLYSQMEGSDPLKLKNVPLTLYYKQQMEWKANDILHVAESVILELIDDCTLSASWDENGSPVAITFAHPRQYLHIQTLENLPGTLSREQKIWLADPKTYGVLLEWLVMSCVEHKHISMWKYLCFGKPSDEKRPHEDILADNWDPLGVHKDVVMKVFPDEFGTDMIKVTVDENGNVVLKAMQIKLGGSYLSPRKRKKQNNTNNTDNTNNTNKNNLKKDTIDHMLKRFQLVSKIETVLKSKIGSKFTTNRILFVTRALSPEASKRITVR